MNDPKKIYYKVDQSGWLSQLRKHTDRMQYLQHLFQLSCDPQLREHCQVLAIDHQDLIVLVRHAAWATRLKYHVHELLKSLKKFKEFSEITRIKIRIKEAPSAIKSPLRANPISEESARIIQTIALQIEDEPLRKAMLKLAKKREEY